MRTDTLFGKNVNVVGDVSADLVLESLGKIYIKSRNKALTLDEIISSLTSSSGESIANKTIIIDGLEELDDIKDGSFIYDKSSGILYIKVDGELVELISVSTLDTRYVKKTGDTMTGALTINTLSGTPPLRVTSASLVKNLNALYLEGLPSSAFALKNKNEVIGGSWQFNNNTYFNHPVYYRANTLHYKDSLHAGSVGTPDFASGFGGYGWRIDGQTNTLTIDYIVVRKAMYVYELVVNKVRATNGSLWVTNSSKVLYACRLKVINADALTIWLSISPSSSSGIDTAIKSAILGLQNHEGLIVTHNGVSIDTWSSDLMASNTGEGLAKSDYNYKNLKVFLCNDLSKVTSFILDVNNSGRTFSFREEDLLSDEASSIFSYSNLFAQDFDTDVVMPIAVIKEGINWYNDSNGADREDVYDVKYVKTYHKYFSQEALSNTPVVYDTNLYLVLFDTENLPVFLPGDILRCLKFTGNSIKYYDAVVCNKLKDSIFVILLAEDILDKSTTIIYDDNLNPTITREEDHINLDFYNRYGSRSRDMQGIVQEGDDIVLIGHLWDVTRQNAVYITSSDDGSPFIDTMSLVNRPDYSVIYYTPTFLTIKLYKGQALPFTGNYYILTNTTEGIQTGLYALAYKTDEEGLTTSYSMELNKIPTRIIIWYKSGDNLYRTNFDDLFDPNLFTDDEREAILSNPVRLQEEPTGDNVTTVLSLMLIKLLMLSKFEEDLTDFTILVLRGYPNEYTLLVTSYEAFDLLLENGETISQEEQEESIILEQDIKKDTITPTRTTKARFGRLDGIIDNRFSIDKQPHGFGLYGENVFLTGEFILSNGKNVADFEKDFLLLSSGIELNSNVFLSLRLDLINLANNTPNYGNLESAGVFLTNNKLILYGDTVMIITLLDELSGNSEPTALFADGKINAKFIATQVIRSNVPLYKNSVTHVAKEVPLSSVNLYNGSTYYTYTGDSLVYEYREPIDYSHYATKYIRKYSRSGEECWLYTDIYGYPKKEITYSYQLTDCSPTTYVKYITDPTVINVTAESPKFILYLYDFNVNTGLYDSQSMYIKTMQTNYLFVQYKYYTDEEHYTQYVWDIQTASTASNTELDEEGNPTTSGTGYVQYLAFKKDLLDVVLWSLNIDGTGNLGGDGIYWDSNGVLNVSGIINALGGKIGNISIKDNCLYKNVSSNLETLTSFYLGGIDGSERLELTNWEQSGGCESGIIKTRTLLNSSYLEITSGKSMEDSNNGVQLTPEGLVWKNEGIPITSSSILFSIVVIPIRDYNGLWLPQIRTNYASFNVYSSIIENYKLSPFSNVNIYMRHPKDLDWSAGGGGIYLIYFPELDNAIYENGTKLYSWGDWMYNRILEGRVIFQATGLGEKRVYNNVSFQDTNTYHEYANIYDYFDFNNETPRAIKANILSYSFGAGKTTQFHYHSPGELSLDNVKHDYNICYFSRPLHTILGNISSNPNEQGNRILYSISENKYNSNNDLWWTYNQLDTEEEKLKFRRLGLFGPDQSLDHNCDYPIDGSAPDASCTDVFKSYTYANESNYPENEKNYARGIRNYIRINTADDDTLNSGGFVLTAFYLSGLNINNSSITATIKQ